MSHANATLTPRGRLKLARLVVEEGWTQARAAERFSISSPRRGAGPAGTGRSGRRVPTAGMVDRPHGRAAARAQLDRRTERRIIGLRVSRRWGPARIAYHLG